MRFAAVLAIAAVIASGSWARPAAARASSDAFCAPFPGTQTRTVAIDPSVRIDDAAIVAAAINEWNTADPPIKFEWTPQSADADVLVRTGTVERYRPVNTLWGGNCAGQGSGAGPRTIEIYRGNLDRFFGSSLAALGYYVLQNLGVVAGLPLSGPWMDHCASAMYLSGSKAGYTEEGCGYGLTAYDLIGLRALYSPASIPAEFPDGSVISDQINGRVLTVGAAGTDGVRHVSLRSRTSTGLVQWSFLPDASGSTSGQLVNSETAQCLSGVGGGVQVLDCQGQSYQRWRFDRKANGVVVLHLVATDEVLDVPAFAGAEGMEPITYPFNDGYNQWWRIG